MQSSVSENEFSLEALCDADTAISGRRDGLRGGCGLVRWRCGRGGRSGSPGSSSTITPTPTKVLPPGSIIYTYHGHSDQVLAVAWSPDGGRIASGSRDMTIQVWDAFTGKHAFTYRGHSNAVASLAWSPDGRRIAPGGNDSTVQGLCCKKYERNAVGMKSHFPVQLR